MGFMKAALLALLPLAASGTQERERIPVDVAVTPDGLRALTLHRDGTAALVDLRTGEILRETAVGPRPFAAAVSGDGRWGVVTNLRSTLMTIRLDSMSVDQSLKIGYEPRGVALSPDGSTAYVALGGEDAVVAVDLACGAIRGRASVGDEPWDVALSPDGTVLAAGNARSGTVSLIDPALMKVVRTVSFPGARNLRRMTATSDWVYVPHIVDRGGTTDLTSIEQGLVLVNRLGRVPLKGDGPAEFLAMDVLARAAADLEDVTVSGDTIAVIAGGIRTVLLLRGELPWKIDPGPFMDKALSRDRTRFQREELGGRPVAGAAIPGTRQLVVANDLSNRLQIVETESGATARAIPLGGPARPVTPERRGEALFHDGDRSWHHWFSCHTCHPDGHTNGGIYDTFNDGKRGNPKKTLSLRGVAATGPWTWHGWQDSLGASVADSFTGTQAGNRISPSQVADVLAYLGTVDFVPPPPPSDDEAVRRGKAVFASRACGDCHGPPLYTSKSPFVAGLEEPGDAHRGYNPPTLRGVGRRGPWMHDGRGRSLQDVLLEHHRPSKLNKKKDLTPAEAADLAAFMRSL
jgi:DNA-binding beta-propeller fold protein YncE